MRTHPLMSLLLLLALLLSACGSAQDSSPDTESTEIDVVATLGQLGDIAQIVGGDRVNVHTLMGAGIDPHLYVASEGDVELLQDAEIIFYNGLFLEAQMTDVLEQLGERKTVVAVGDAVPQDALLPWASYADEFDPHIWFDVTLWMRAVETIADTYATFDPEHADTYRANAQAYLAELETLHAYVQEQAARVPEGQRILVTAHDAFHYFGRTYGFQVRGLQGISTAAEAGTADVRDLAQFIVEHRIPAIFIESSVPVRTVEALQAAVAAQGYQVAIGGELFSDAMGDPGGEGGTYIDMVRHNIDTIVGALLEQP